MSNWKEYLSVGNLSANLVMRNFTYVLFLFLLATLYIANAHFSEKQIRNIQEIQEDIQKYRWKFLSQKSKLMYENKQSEVEDHVDELGIKDAKTPPEKLIVPKKSWYN
ncbi:MAG: hypothetical protein KA974_03355 [Saprospiraceae bacterium]|nr:hypothetical protein [Saprospiraceae bacterium]